MLMGGSSGQASLQMTVCVVSLGNPDVCILRFFPLEMVRFPREDLSLEPIYLITSILGDKWTKRVENFSIQYVKFYLISLFSFSIIALNCAL